MQAIPADAADPVSISSHPDLLPGPFFLLLLLPAIPLLLFSVGARPPDSSSLPSTTNDLWQTTALVTVAGAVVLCVGLYPGLLSGMGGWIVNGDYTPGLNLNKWVDKVWISGRLRQPAATPDIVATPQIQVQQLERILVGSDRPGIRHQTGQGRISRERPPQLTPPNRVPAGVPLQRADPKGRWPWWRKVEPKSERQRMRNAASHLPRRQHVERPVVLAPAQKGVSLDARALSSRGQQHLAHLRESPYFPWSSPSRPALMSIIFTTIISTVLLIVIVGKFIGDGYDADSKSRSPPSSRSSREESSSSSGNWVQDEYAKRKMEKDTPNVTDARVNKDRLEWETKYAKGSAEEKKKATERRAKEIAKLKSMLESRKLPPVGLEAWGGDAKVTKTGTKVEVKKDDGEGKPLKGWERFLLGREKTDGSKAEKRKVTVMDTVAEGPGWKISEEGMSQVAMAQQASRAEELARGMKAA